jgi:hypothetical protein
MQPSITASSNPSISILQVKEVRISGEKLMKHTHVRISARAPHVSRLLCIIWSNRNTGKNYKVSSTLRYVIPITQNYIAHVARGSWSTQINTLRELGGATQCARIFTMLLYELLLTRWLFCLNNQNGWTFATHLLFKEFYIAHFQRKRASKRTKSRSKKTLLLAELEKASIKICCTWLQLGQLCVVKLKRLNPLHMNSKVFLNIQIPHPLTNYNLHKTGPISAHVLYEPQLR